MASEHAAETKGHHNDTQDGRQLQDQMRQACRDGDVKLLQELLDSVGVTKGDAPVDGEWNSSSRDWTTVLESGPAATIILLRDAVIGGHAQVVQLLLETYPTAGIEDVLFQALEHPNLPVFKLLHAHNPSVIEYEFPDNGTILVMALRHGAGNPDIPEYLLDHGTDPDEFAMGVTPPIVAAIGFKQPLFILEKLVNAGARVSTMHVVCSVQARRVDITTHLLERCYIHDEDELEQNVGQCVREWGNEEVLASFRRRTKQPSKKSKWRILAKPWSK